MIARNVIFLLTIHACSMSAQDNWTPMADFTADRHWATAFSIGNTGYVFGGTLIGTSTEYNDLWAFDPVADTWTEKSDLPGQPRSQAGVLVLNGKAYLCGGKSGTTAMDEVWEYDPLNNSWTQKAPFPGGPRRAGIAFTIGNKGYFGSGAAASGTADDLWEYDPGTDSWTQKADFPAGDGHLAYASFSIAQKGYVVGGLALSSTAMVLNETWEYDPLANSWTQKANYPHQVGQAAGFALNDRGYVFAGNKVQPIEYFNDLNEYDPTTDTWTPRASLPAAARSGVSAIALNGKGYAGLGFSANLTGYNDWWEYTPLNSTGTGVDASENGDLQILYPNPATEKIHVEFTQDGADLVIVDNIGAVVMEIHDLSRIATIDVSELSPGLYHLRMIGGPKAQRFVKH